METRYEILQSKINKPEETKERVVEVLKVDEKYSKVLKLEVLDNSKEQGTQSTE